MSWDKPHDMATTETKSCAVCGATRTVDTLIKQRAPLLAPDMPLLIRRHETTYEYECKTHAVRRAARTERRRYRRTVTPARQ